MFSFSLRLSRVALLLALTTPSLVWANPIDNANRQLSVDVGVQSMNYREYDSQGLTANGLLDRDVGTQPSLQISYSLPFDALGVHHWLVRFSSLLARGHTTYTGYNQALTSQGVVLTPLRTNALETTANLNLSLGKSFYLGPSVALTPYVAYSFERWSRDIEQSIGDTGENNHHHFVGAGLFTQVALSERWVASVDLAMGENFAARAVTASGTMRYGSRPEEHASLGVDYAISQRWHANLAYSVQHTTYGTSPVVNGYFEPPSHSLNQQVMVGLGYVF